MYQLMIFTLSCLVIGVNCDKTNCGSIYDIHKINKNVNSKVNGRIFGGEDVKNFYPWFIGFTKLPLRVLPPVIRNGIHCGGSLITAKHVLTAAHCFEDEIYSVKLFVAISNLRNMCKFDNAKNVHRINRIFRHSEYNNILLINDIAIVELKNDINQMPICLPTSKNMAPIPPRRVEVIGYGLINNLNQLPCRLQGVYINVYENKTCAPVNSAYFENTKNTSIADTIICAGELDGYLDSCQGDSGGPLQDKTSNTSSDFTLLGIVSHGRGCGKAGFLGIYTNVSHYLDWIKKYISL